MKRLVSLLERGEQLIMSGAHDVLSARLVEAAGFDAVWASSLGISATMGLPDTGIITLTELIDRVTPMGRCIDIPLLVDCDTGFGSPQAIARVSSEFQWRGISGLCIEDQAFPKRNSYMGVAHRLAPLEVVCNLIGAARKNAPDVAIVARTESLVAGFAYDEALTRGRAYEDAGAHALVVQTTAETDEPLREVASRWNGSIPLVAIPTRVKDVRVSELHTVGFDVVIFANQALRAAVAAMESMLERVAKTGGLSPEGPDLVPMEALFNLTRSTLEVE